MDVELHVRYGPARGQIFQGRGRDCFDPLGVIPAQIEFVGEGHRKTTTQRGGDQFVWVGSDALGKSGSVRILGP